MVSVENNTQQVLTKTNNSTRNVKGNKTTQSNITFSDNSQQVSTTSQPNQPAEKTQGQLNVDRSFEELTKVGNEIGSKTFAKGVYGERTTRHSQQFLEQCENNGINPTSEQAASMKYFINESIDYAPYENKEALLNNLKNHFPNNEKLQNLSPGKFNSETWGEIVNSLNFGTYINKAQTTNSKEDNQLDTPAKKQEAVNEAFDDLSEAGEEQLSHGLLKGLYGERTIRHSRQFLEKCEETGINPTPEQANTIKDYIAQGIKYAQNGNKEELLNNLKKHFPNNEKLQNLSPEKFNRETWGEIVNSLDFSKYINNN